MLVPGQGLQVSLLLSELLRLLLSPHKLLLLVSLVVLCGSGGFARRLDHVEMFLPLLCLLYLLLLLLVLLALERLVQIVLGAGVGSDLMHLSLDTTEDFVDVPVLILGLLQLDFLQRR